MPITDLLTNNAALYGNEVALVEINPENRERRGTTWREYALVETVPRHRYRRELTWAAFDEEATRFANLLMADGIQKGERVAILLMNSIEWLPVYFGVLRAGAVAVPLNYRYTADEIKYCLELSDSHALVFGPEFVGRVEEIVDRLGDVRLTYFVGEQCPSFADSYRELMSYSSTAPVDMPLTDEDEAAVYFSSGTTGFPKAILHNHLSLMHSARVEQAHHGQQRGDVFLCIPPLYHTGAKMHWFGSLISGSRAVLLKGVRPDWILETVSEERCTIVWLLVPWAQDILDAIDDGRVRLDNYQLDQWRLMHIGAQPVPPSLIKRWKAIFPHHAYDTNYGLSESIGPGCVHLGVENEHKVGAIGKAGFGWEAEVRREDGELVTPGAHDVGELRVRGDGLMACYYKDPEATAASLRDGWLYTGDMAEVDEDGFIWLVDRKKDVIIMGGENIYPVQIENFLRAHDAIKDAAVIGVPDQRLGETTLAVIELKEGRECTVADIEEFCLDLPRYKRPRHIIFEEIPRNPTGKIEKPVLRARHGALRVVEQQNTQ